MLLFIYLLDTGDELSGGCKAARKRGGRKCAIAAFDYILRDGIEGRNIS